jgi:hypothetical protein
VTDADPLAWAAMVAYCGWDPTEQVTDRTVLLDGTGTRLLALPSLYVTDVSAVSMTDCYGETSLRPVAPVAYPSLGTATTADVGWSENGVLIWNGYLYGGWPSGQRNISVTYSGGYNVLPDDLQAALDSVGKRTAGMLGATSRRMGTAAVAFSGVASEGGLLLVEQMVFDRYRLFKVA